jgi:hypothetical protein
MTGDHSDWDDDDLGALSFSADTEQSDESAVAALGDFVTTGSDETGTAILDTSFLQEMGTEDSKDFIRVTVNNPPRSVAVSVLQDGSIGNVELSGTVVGMRESELAAEILALADLAWLKGKAAEHTFMVDILRQIGVHDEEVITDFVENGMEVPSPEEAEAARAEVFAARYATEHD